MTAKTCTIFQDGKLGRGVPATIIKNEGKRILIEFSIEVWDDEANNDINVTYTLWFVKRYRDNGGAFECIDWNYWFYNKVSI